jgi:cobalt/nickel transport system ATP-binding protein
LSVGEKKRAAIATVYSMYPEVYVFDEPTSSLDPRGRRSIIALLQKLGKTQVILSHDLAMIGELCSRIIVMDNGRIVADDKAETVLSDTTMLESCGLL